MSKKIKLTQGQYTTVDDDIYELIKHHKWHALYSKNAKSFYAIRTISFKNKSYKLLLSRYIMDLEKGDKRVVDHINHNTLMNERSNLRVVSNRENLQNQKRKDRLNYSCSSRYAGIYWSKLINKWHAILRLGKKQQSLGFYLLEKEAVEAYKKACKELKETGTLDINNYNVKTKSKCTSKYKGVCRRKNKWGARISIDNKRVYLGVFTTEEEAHRSILNYKKERGIK